MLAIFFFKQKTAYEMRISDWSSDVCSSDLDVSYPDAFDPKLLFPIDRATNRQTLQIPGPWFGADIWNAYEVSWLNLKGKPLVALARFVVPQESPRLIESKSFKLYLNSFNDERFDSFQAVREDRKSTRLNSSH